MSSENPNDGGILIDHEQAPQSSCANLFVPQVPTLLDDLKTEEVTNSDVQGLQTTAKLQNEEKEGAGINNLSSISELLQSDDASATKRPDINSPSVSVVDEPKCTEILEYEVLSGSQNTSRLVIVSWKIRQFSILAKAVKTGVFIFQYKADSSLHSILSQSRELLNGQKVVSLAFVGHGNPGTLTLCTNKVLSAKTVGEDSDVKQFFYDLVIEFIDQSNPNCHLDFLATSLLLSGDGQFVIQTLQDYIRIPITASKDILGTDNIRPENDIRNTGELYFTSTMVRSWSGSVSQSISSYEKIRTLGRGAYGTAVLYRKKDDDSLVVLKEITILDLNAVERQAAMNEVKVLGMLSHPNIVSYYDSFDEDGTLWIEMEYADGGTLSDYLSKQESELEERDILIMFSQMVSAIKYCHDHNILHRDLKTQNIFLTQEFKVKLGDFGIAKIMNTNTGGNFSVVGTPYYISPEMCEGKSYDSKSDIWALGCVLYEMANLTRTFDGTNLPALINKIVKGTFAPIKETYTAEFRLLVRDLLQKDPVLRPNAEEILFTRLQELLQRYDHVREEDIKEPLHYARTRSLIYFCDVSTMQLYPINELPTKILVSEVSIGLGHIVVISVERGVFTWGDNSYGQLGHGDLEHRDHPTEVVLLRGKSITRAFCGDYFTLFLSDNGLVLSCGQGNFGSLGHGDLETLTRPKLIDELIMLDIASLSAGSYHVSVCTAEGVAYTWGRGDDGRLGHGNDTSLGTPTKVEFASENVFIKSVHCSYNGTVFVADTGNVFACGRNFGNKLGLNPRQGFLLQFRSRSSKNIVESVNVPTLVKDLCKYQLLDIKFGTSHFTIINDKRVAYSNGNNSEGQLGCGNTKHHEAITMVKSLEEDHVSIIACGSTFSLAAVQEVVGKNTTNSIYFWGTKPHSNRKRPLVINDSLAGKGRKNRALSAYDDDNGTSSDPDASRQSNSAQSRDSVFLEARSSHSDNSRSPSGREDHRKKSAMSRKFVPESRKPSAISVPEESYSDSIFQDIVGNEIDNGRRMYLKSLFKGTNTQTLNLVPKDNAPCVFPRLVFKFQSVGNIEGCDDDEEYPVVLQDIKCFQDHVIFHLETTAPPPKKKKVAKKLDSSCSSATSAKEESSENSEAETTGEVPTWIRNELEYGIPVSRFSESGNMAGPSEDEKSNSGENTLTDVTPVIKRRSFDSKDRKNSSIKRRDPNFDLIPKIQRQVTMLKLTETDGLSGTLHMSETQIIDGVAVSKSIAEIQNQLMSPCPSDQPTDEENVNAGSTDEPLKNVIGNIESEMKNALPHTPTSPDTATSKIPKLRNKTAEASEVGNKNSPVVVKPDVDKTSKERSIQQQQSKGRSKRNAKVEKEHKTKTLNNPRDKSKNKDIDERLSSASDMDDARERRRVKERKKDGEKHVLEEAQRLAKISEERLLQEIKELKDEKEKREESLQEMHDRQLKEREEQSRHQIEDAKKREDLLKDEILNLKTDLNNQNGKLQDNYNILLSLQEQLLRMQQNQLRSTPGSSTPTKQKNDATKSLSQVEHKSKVCALM